MKIFQILLIDIEFKYVSIPKIYQSFGNCVIEQGGKL